MSTPAPEQPDLAPQTEEAAVEETAAPAPPDEATRTPAPGDPATDAPGEVVEPSEVQEPDAAATDYLALAQRTQADFENFRRRATRDAAVAGDRGVARLAKELLPALDHLELALQAAESDSDSKHVEWAKGIRLIQSEFLSALARVGVQPFSPDGESFDPVEHEAMAEQPAEGAEPGTVVTVYQQGYRHNGQVLRPARVIVAA